jgi:hypothetical protein
LLYYVPLGEFRNFKRKQDHKRFLPHPFPCHLTLYNPNKWQELQPAIRIIYNVWLATLIPVMQQSSGIFY